MSDNAGTVFLRGRKVNLRPVNENDLPHFVRWINDPQIRDFITVFLPVTIQEEKQWLEELAKSKPNNMVFVIETKAGRTIGNMGVHHIDWRNRTATTGAIIGEKDCWGQGYGSEAKILLLNHLFNSMNLHKILSQAIAFNKRSIAYSLKCGYRHEGVLKKHVFRKGRYWDVVNLAIFSKDFPRIWRKYQQRKIG